MATPAPAPDIIRNAWLWSQATGRVLRELEVGEDLYRAYEATLTPFVRHASEPATPSRQLLYKTALIKPHGPGWGVRVVREDDAV